MTDPNICYFAVEHDVSDSDERVVSVHGYDSTVSADRFFTDLSKIICFSDCTNDVAYMIVWHGEETWYDGWKPGMVYRYVGPEGRVVWEGRFPEWDH